ncbi:MAG: nucleotide exchange factor GrpE [Parachlamydiaceae bacterium]|nr:nucleotide exchange factor GrpE [Parachlamydiaceae bacterium]
MASNEDLSNIDPSAEWPEEVKEAYRNLKIPSIYDCVLANEKMGVEIHKQNREMKEVTGNLQEVVFKLNTMMELLSQELEVYEFDDDYEGEEGFEGTLLENYEPNLSDLEIALLKERTGTFEKHSQDLIIGVTDDLLNLSKTTKQLTKQLTDTLPPKEGQIPDIVEWKKLIGEYTEALIENIHSTLYRSVSKLNDIDIQIIDPKVGDPFVPDMHNSIDKISGGKPGMIARLVRLGFIQDSKVLRPADVVIYS